MSDGNSKVIPFGKHKGRLVDEVLIDDPGYLQWLMGQGWFREKQPALYQIIINRGAEPEETPEHNALQVLFLEDDFCLRFAKCVVGGFVGSTTQDIAITRNFECRGVDVTLTINDRRKPPNAPRPDTIAVDEKALESQKERCPTNNASWETLVAFATEIGLKDYEIEFAKNDQYYRNNPEKRLHRDIQRRLEAKRESIKARIETLDRDAAERWYQAHAPLRAELLVEIKPTVGDDYPAVLRQMRAQRPRYGYEAHVLFLERYTGVGATEEQFIKTMKSADIKVIFRHQIELEKKGTA